MNLKLILTLSALSSLSALSGCNFWGLIDGPSGNEQILSYARGCFDKGDFECALEQYAKLEGTTYDDIAKAETAFVELDQEGAGMGNFMASFFDGDGGRGITRLGRRMHVYGRGPSATRRANIYAAFRRHLTIAAPETSGLVQFVGATALIGELLSEEAEALNEDIVQSLIVNSASVTSCMASMTCVGCSKTGTGFLSTGAAIDLSAVTPPAQIAGTRSLDLINAALTEIDLAVSKMGVGGSFSGLATFSAAFNIADLGTGGACFRQSMLLQNMGKVE